MIKYVFITLMVYLTVIFAGCSGNENKELEQALSFAGRTGQNSKKY
jgi:hypothetical protein